MQRTREWNPAVWFVESREPMIAIVRRHMADVTITLDSETILVLSACLARWDEDEQPLELRDAAEEYAMLQVVARLESTLVEPFRVDYDELLEKARAELRRRAGAD